MEGIALSLCSWLLWRWNLEYKNRQKLYQSYICEKKGRISAEKENRHLIEAQLNTKDGLYVQAIGTLFSCYRQCLGTPRQGLLVPSSRAFIKLNTSISPEALDSLEEFSHIWILFVFHLNTNSAKEIKALTGYLSETRTKYTFSAKVVPPMAKEKKGVFATRSPHRPNPIGITLAKIESVDKNKRIVYLSSCDLVEGTPILDFKPYVPYYDSINPSIVPSWIEDTIETRNEVSIDDSVRNWVENNHHRLRDYKNNPHLFLNAIQETLAADVRSKYQTKKGIEDARLEKNFYFPLDNAMIYYLWQSERSMVVKNISLAKSVSSSEQ